jgi:putative ABC transport system permease protein
VLQRTREIGIRMALGARASHIVRSVTAQVFAMLLAGSAMGIAAGMSSARLLETLLFSVKATDFTIVAAPLASLFTAALLTALPPVIMAVRIDPARALRGE